MKQAQKAQSIISDPPALRAFIMRQLLNHSNTMKTESNQIRALELLGKTICMFTDKVETKVERVDPEQIKAELEKRLLELTH